MKTFALMSGKGGSGKTTLSLSIAALLSDCAINVLLVDCDLSTNGATYFYETKLSEQKVPVTSFNEVIKSNRLHGEIHMININEYMDFMPSIAKITKESTEPYRFNESDTECMKRLLESFARNYDVVIFDTQAGYTDVLRLVLPFVDVSLFVLEADAINSSALRGMYIKIEEYLGDKVYQTFNKVTKEEYEWYSKLSGGTLFTNIESLRFDWKIRKAFSVAEIPDMKNTSADYGMQIYQVCCTIFKETFFQDKLNKYYATIAMKENREMIETVKTEIFKRKSDLSVQKAKLTTVFFTVVCLTMGLLVLMMLFDNSFYESNSMTKNIIAITMFVSAMALTYSFEINFLRNQRNKRKEMEDYQRKLKELEANNEKLELEYEKYEAEKKKTQNNRQTLGQQTHNNKPERKK